MKSLKTVVEVARLIERGQHLLLAGDERLLSRLPRGSWVGGTIPYFMDDGVAVESSDLVFVTELPADFVAAELRPYPAEQLHELPRDYADNGVSFIVLPAGGATHRRFARDGSTWRGFFDRPLVGWVAGTALDRLGVDSPRVFDGSTGRSFLDAAVVLHARLAPGVVARTDIINLFEPAAGSPVITFEEEGFSARWCRVDGVRRPLAEFLHEVKADARWPLIADFLGARLNVSFQGLDGPGGRVDFYAPVFVGVEYRLARALTNYEQALRVELDRRRATPVFTCNCVLNYVYAELAGKSTAQAPGPFTFGEIAWMLLNQTVVSVTLERRAE